MVSMPRLICSSVALALIQVASRQAPAPAARITRLSMRACGGESRSTRRLIETCARRRVSSGIARKMAAHSM